jgi:hypothetical protein
MLKKKFKVGLDVHGVVDTFDIFAAMAKLNMDAGHEVHIITGQLYDKNMEEALLKSGCEFTHYYSIVGHLQSKGADLVKWDEKGFPSADPELWNAAKAEYCEDQGIDILFDDSPTYAKYFDNIDTIYCQVHNPNRKLYATRG